MRRRQEKGWPQIDEQQPAIGDQPADRRARLYRARGIVLRRRDIGETDRVVTVFTAEHGRKRFVAKGSRRPGSKLAGHLEPYSATRLLIARARTLDIVSQAELIEPFAPLRGSEQGIATAAYLAELVDTLLPEDQEQEAVYELLFAGLRLLAEGRDALLVTHVFEMGLLRLLGYRPELHDCIVCRTPLEQEVNGFSPDGGVVCRRCQRARPEAMPISVNGLKLLRAIDRGEIERLFKLRVQRETWDEVGDALNRYIVRVTGQESRSRRVLLELRLE
jgi:DNA repair protein RecO (recombination protein O)